MQWRCKCYDNFDNFRVGHQIRFSKNSSVFFWQLLIDRNLFFFGGYSGSSVFSEGINFAFIVIGRVSELMAWYLFCSCTVCRYICLCPPSQGVTNKAPATTGGSVTAAQEICEYMIHFFKINFCAERSSCICTINVVLYNKTLSSGVIYFWIFALYYLSTLLGWKNRCDKRLRFERKQISQMGSVVQKVWATLHYHVIATTFTSLM